LFLNNGESQTAKIYLSFFIPVNPSKNLKFKLILMPTEKSVLFVNTLGVSEKN